VASFSFGAGNAGKLLRIPLYALGRIATALVPRSRDLWVFGSAVGLADGAWALWEHARAAGERAVWLTGSAADDEAARLRGIPFARKGTLRGFRLTARAAVTVVTHGFGDVNRYAATGGVIVQLWHGIPLKRIGLDTTATTASPLPILRGPAEALLSALYRRTQGRIRVLPAASELVRGRLESAFGLRGTRVPVTGEPRTDVLTRGTAQERRARARTQLAELVDGVDDETPIVLYAPTWRDGAADPALPGADDVAALVDALDAAGALLLIRSHHLGSGDYAALQGARTRALGSDVVADVTPLLPGIDVLITDYSSLAYDAAYVPVPTVFFASDLDDYARSRGFYGTYADVAGADPARTWRQLAGDLRATLTEPAERARRADTAAALSARVHAYADGRSTERVYREIKRIQASAAPIERAP